MPAKLVAKLERVKPYFKTQYDWDLEYVFFPDPKHHLTSQVNAVEAAGYTVFGATFPVGVAFHKRSRGSIRRDIHKLAKHDKGIIVHHSAHNKHMLKDVGFMFRYLRDNDLEIVNLDQCLEEVVPIMANALKGEAELETKDGGAAGLGFSFAIAAATLALFAL